MSLIELNSDELHAIGAFPLSFKSEESLSRAAHYALDVECPQPDVDFEPLLGKRVTVSIEEPSGLRRPFNAYIIGGEDRGQHGNHYVFGLKLSCWLWFLQQNRNCRIFQHLNVLEIVGQIFARYGVANYRLDIEGSYAPREYCVQFAETDFNFISRLLEDEGLGYTIEHAEDEHTLVISDRQQFSDLPVRYQTLLFTPDAEEGRAIREGVQRIQRQRVVSPNEIVLRDFDYLNPRKNLQTKAEENAKGLSETPLEWYDYASGYVDTERGEWLARLRLEELQVQGQMLVGDSNAVGLVPGRRFDLLLHPDPRRNRGYKLLRCDYEFIQDGPDSSSQGRNVLCRFTAVNDDVAWRPLRITPSPRLPGLQSATVVGTAGAEVHTDEHARIRVHFHWDRYKTREEDSSCWIRVVQAWAGKGWGVLAMPRVGQEVLVTYVDGDLDRPMVTGIVYNGDNPPPYRLPEQINYSGMISRSLRQGQPQHASQLTFDDRRNNERLMMHAERDLQTTVERNAVSDIGQDQYRVVKRTRTLETENEVDYRDNHVSQTDTRVDNVGNHAEKISNRVQNIDASTSNFGIATRISVLELNTTALKNEMTGLSNSVVGTSLQSTGVATSITGALTAFTAIETLLVGESSAVVGARNRVVGNDVQAVGSEVLAKGSTIAVTGSHIRVVGSDMAIVGASINKMDLSVVLVGMQMAM